MYSRKKKREKKKEKKNLRLTDKRVVTSERASSIAKKKNRSKQKNLRGYPSREAHQPGTWRPGHYDKGLKVHPDAKH